MKRILTGLVAIVGWLALLYSQWFLLFWLTISIISLFGAYEFLTISLQEEGKKRLPALLLICLIPLFISYFQRMDLVFALLICALIVNACFVVFSAANIEKPFDFLVKTNFAIIYTGLFGACLVLTMAQPNGAAWLLFLTTITAASDTGAYFVGKSLGKNKLCPSISPGKTVEGFIGGMLSGTGCALLVAYLVFNDANLFRLAIAALFLSVLGVIGDLVESLFKRGMGVKDSGTILPGHGGILDRVDSLLLTAPILYLLISFHLLG